MNILSRNKVLAAGIALVLLTNIVVISGAIYNRSGEPDAVLDLNERELDVSNMNTKENSGLSLRLNWNGYFYDYDARLRLTPGRLKELGYELIDSDDDDAIRKYVRKQLPRAAWVVLEFDGAVYHKALQDAEQKYQEEKRLYSHEPDSEAQKNRLQEAERNLSWTRNSASRLYAVDAGLEPQQLRQRYPDRSHYVVTPGVVRLTYDYNGKTGAKLDGYISEISVSNIHVPLAQRTVFDSLPEMQYDDNDHYYPRNYQPRFRARLAWGRRYEPWLVNVEATANNSD